jgi:hypothetical protein
MRAGISGTHGTGKTTLAQALCPHLPAHVTADEPYYLLEEEGCEFRFPPSLEDYRALLACSVRSLGSLPLLPAVIFDRTPLDYLAYMAATGADPSDEASAAALRPAFASLDLLVITPITPETEQLLPPAAGRQGWAGPGVIMCVAGGPGRGGGGGFRRRWPARAAGRGGPRATSPRAARPGRTGPARRCRWG